MWLVFRSVVVFSVVDEKPKVVDVSVEVPFSTQIACDEKNTGSPRIVNVYNMHT